MATETNQTELKSIDQMSIEELETLMAQKRKEQ